MPRFIKKEGRAWKVKSPKMRRVFKHSRLAGIEWEFNDDRDTFPAVTKWSNKWRGGVHVDGSCGYEAVTPPLSGDYIARCITDLGKALKRDRARMDRDCSVHVHIDATDLTLQQLYRILWVYSLVEDRLFELAGNHRRASDYCCPCGSEYRQALSYYFKSTKNKSRDYLLDIQDEVKGVCNQDRYQALNLCNYFYKRAYKAKTLEFRLHENASAKESQRVIRWVQLLVKLVDWAKEATDQEVASLPSKNAHKVLRLITGLKKRTLKSA